MQNKAIHTAIVALMLSVCCAWSIPPRYLTKVEEKTHPDVPTLYEYKPALGYNFPRPSSLQKPVLKVEPGADSETIDALWGGYVNSSTVNYQGMWNIPLKETSSMLLQIGDNNLYPNGGGVLIDNCYFSFRYYGDLTKDTQVSLQGFDSYGNFQAGGYWGYDYAYAKRTVDWVATDMALNPDDNIVYGCFYNANLDGFELAQIEGLEFYNSFNATRTAIADLEMPLCAVGFTADGVMYGLTFLGELVQVDITDGKYTLIGDTGIDPYYYTGGTIHNGKFYYLWAGDNDNTAAYEIDLATAGATKVASANGIQILKGLFIKNNVVKKGPKAPVNVRTEFEGISTTGKIIFDVPELSQSEEPGEGDLSFKITEGETVLASGQTTYGQIDVTADVDVKTEGFHYLSITLTDADGNVSPEASTALNIGYGDSPDEVKNVLAYYDNGIFYAKWDPVTTGNYGTKPLDPSKVTYRARLYQGNTQVPYIDTYKGSETSCEIAYKAPGTKSTIYNIRVDVSITDKFNSWGYATSNNVLSGGSDLPYEQDFTRYDCLDKLCVWDNNGDGKTFTWFSNAGGEARMQANWDNREIAEDDWLIFPGVKLEAGSYYEFSMDYYTMEGNPERFGVWMGNEANPHALTTPVIAEDVREQYDRATISGGFVATETGTFFFGLHSSSDPDTYWLTIDNVKIVNGGSGGAPQAPTQLTIEPDKTGLLSAKISFVAPEALLNGTENTSDKYEKVELYRGSEFLTQQTNVIPGTTVTFEDRVDADGYYTYKAIVYNTEGGGLPAEATRFIGVNRPVAPWNVVTTEDENTPGKVTVKWDPVTTDIDGYYLDPSNVTYSIANYEGNVTYVTGVQGNQATFQATEEGEQRFDLFTVLASTRAGDSEYLGYAQMMPIGQPDAMPYFLSFDSTDEHIFTSMALSGGTRIQLGTTNSEIPVDGNGNGTFLMYSGDSTGDRIDLVTGKVHVDASAKNPRLVYYLFNVAADNENLFGILINDEVAQTTEIKTLPTGKWSRVTFDLTSYKGKDIYIKARGVINNYSFLLFDGIEVVDMPDNDMAIISVDVPAQVNPDETFKVTTTLQNIGVNDAKGAKLQIFRNDELLFETDEFDLAGGDMMRVNLSQTLTLLDCETMDYAMKLKWNADGVAANNETNSIVVLNLPNYPTVALTGELDDNQDALLKWSTPDPMPEPAASVTDDFEGYTPFTFGNVGKWTMIDGDKEPVGELLFKVPGMTPGQTTTSFVHFDLTQLSGFDFNGFDNCSGTGFICSIYTDRLTRRDDWAISPLLNGNAQTVKFMARSMSGNESFQALYSTTGTEPDDFTVIKQEALVPNQWKEYAYDLPEGALYFAIRDNSNRADILYVDDFTYAPGIRPEVIGYNVYRDGVLITETPVDTHEFTDTSDCEDGTHVYAVTVVYGEGESAASNTVALQTSALGSIDATAASVAVEGRSIVVSNIIGTQVTITTTDGRTVYNAAGTGRNVAPVQPGIYIVKAGNLVKKVLVI